MQPNTIIFLFVKRCATIYSKGLADKSNIKFIMSPLHLLDLGNPILYLAYCMIKSIKIECFNITIFFFKIKEIFFFFVKGK